LEEIYRRLSHVDGNIEATVKRLSPEEARSIAHDIVVLFLEVCGGWK
jgi:hypothetical protein